MSQKESESDDNDDDDDDDYEEADEQKPDNVSCDILLTGWGCDDDDDDDEGGFLPLHRPSVLRDDSATFCFQKISDSASSSLAFLELRSIVPSPISCQIDGPNPREAVILEIGFNPHIKNDRYAHAELFPKGFLMKSIFGQVMTNLRSSEVEGISQSTCSQAICSYQYPSCMTNKLGTMKRSVSYALSFANIYDVNNKYNWNKIDDYYNIGSTMGMRRYMSKKPITASKYAHETIIFP